MIKKYIHTCWSVSAPWTVDLNMLDCFEKQVKPSDPTGEMYVSEYIQSLQKWKTVRGIMGPWWSYW